MTRQCHERTMASYSRASLASNPQFLTLWVICCCSAGAWPFGSINVGWATRYPLSSMMKQLHRERERNQKDGINQQSTDCVCVIHTGNPMTSQNESHTRCKQDLRGWCLKKSVCSDCFLSVHSVPAAQHITLLWWRWHTGTFHITNPS